jgi:glycosyltransferase involved in cell wall biosynthesis
MTMVPQIAFVSQPRDGLNTEGPQHGSVAIVLKALSNSLANQFGSMAVAPVLKGQAAERVVSVDGLTIHRIAAGNRQYEKALEILDPRPVPRSLHHGYYRAYFRKAAEVLAQEKPDLVHVMSWAQAGDVLAHALPGVPLVLHLHDDMLTRLSPELVMLRLVPFAAVVTCSSWLATRLRLHVPDYAGKIVAINNGIEPLVFARSPRPAKIAQGSTLLMVGRISPEKGPHILIDAFTRLATAYPRLRLQLAGPVGFLPLSQARFMGSDMPAMAEAIERLYGHGLKALYTQMIQPTQQLKERLVAGMPDTLHQRVHFLGPQPHDRLVDIYQSADVLVQPSVWNEAFGMPVAEAMAAALPVVASACGGLCDLVDDGRTGRLVPPGDSEALASAIASLLDNPVKAREFGLAGQRRALRLFTWEQAAKRLGSVYDDVLTQHQRSHQQVA